MGSLAAKFDVLALVFFVVHIPVTLLFDSQAGVVSEITIAAQVMCVTSCLPDASDLYRGRTWLRRALSVCCSVPRKVVPHVGNQDQC